MRCLQRLYLSPRNSMTPNFAGTSHFFSSCPITFTLLAFPRDRSMSRVIGDWKHFHARKNRIEWQEGFFDHRLRDDERGEQLQAKVNYIRQNPVVAGLCADAKEWPWVIDRSSQLLG